MLTVKQAKDLGVVFVEGDVIENTGNRERTTIRQYEGKYVNMNDYYASCQVISLTDRKHKGNEMPCDGDLTVITMTSSGIHTSDLAHEINWGVIKSWKPDLEALEKLVNEKEEKPMTQNQHTYEVVTDLTINEIAKAMIDGTKYYNSNGMFMYEWFGVKFISRSTINEDFAIELDLESLKFYRRKEIEMATRTITYPKPVSGPLGYGDGYYRVDGDGVQSCTWRNSISDKNALYEGRIHLTKENAQAHRDAIFGVKNENN